MTGFIRSAMTVLVAIAVLGAAACGTGGGAEGDEPERVADAEKCSSDEEMGRSFCPSPNGDDHGEASEHEGEGEEHEGEEHEGKEHEEEPCEVEAPEDEGGEEEGEEGDESDGVEVEQYDYQCMTRIYGVKGVKAISQY